MSTLLDANTFRELVSGHRRGLGAATVRGLLNLLEFPYFSLTRLRNFLYDSGVFPTHRLPIPIISVGNLTLGGTGKSPLVAWIGRFFLDQGIQPGMISRGYGQSSNGVNDEFLELAFRLPSIPHRLNRNRVAAAQDFLNSQNIELLILDDAFQHRRIHRNLDIVLLDALEPFGYEHIFPRGMLRESITALRRADVVFLSRADWVDEPQRRKIRDRVMALSPNILWGEIVHEPQSLVSIPKREREMKTEMETQTKTEMKTQMKTQTNTETKTTIETDISAIRDKRILAFCGIGNPNAFHQTLENCGAHIIELVPFPDHHQFKTEDLDELEKIAKRENVDSILCTMKDFVKIERIASGSIPIQAVLINVRFLSGETAFRKLLTKQL
ncbi:MAG: tetraacyldisaccharide 4'-kinase [Planctomycetaceae bacterium]|jgi:tetraacyldisaccharide 4'-kinase|nr:tetraacyldisaccharide 4'-kinase [Planctomycetaceae bacterium]